MLKRIVSLLGSPGEPTPASRQDRIQLAVAVLLVEMAHADKFFEPLERKLIHDQLRQKFSLSREAAEELIEAAEAARHESFDLHQFTRLINDHFSRDEKLEVMETLWRIVYADGELDKYEDAMARQLTALLRLSPRDVIDLKVKVLDEIDPARNG